MKEEPWREWVSRITMALFGLALLAGAAGVARLAWRGFGVNVVSVALVVGFGYAGLFLLKRAVVPTRFDERVPQARIGENWDGWWAWWWSWF